MTLLILSYLGGVLTILSPCILPVLPFVFARADQPFVTNGLPLLVGMALTFAGVATLAALGGGWAVHANQYGRIAALILLAFFVIHVVVGEVAPLLFSLAFNLVPVAPSAQLSGVVDAVVISVHDG